LKCDEDNLDFFFLLVYKVFFDLSDVSLGDAASRTVPAGVKVNFQSHVKSPFSHHFPFGAFFKETHEKWNHSMGHASFEHSTMFPKLARLQRQ
jgi:hypothetical protein